MKMVLVAVLAAVSFFAVADEKPPQRIFSETAEQKSERMSWWTHDRFGMFIHFGLYAAPARHEWMKSREGMSDKADSLFENRRGHMGLLGRCVRKGRSPQDCRRERLPVCCGL